MDMELKLLSLILCSAVLLGQIDLYSKPINYNKEEYSHKYNKITREEIDRIDKIFNNFIRLMFFDIKAEEAFYNTVLLDKIPIEMKENYNGRSVFVGKDFDEMKDSKIKARILAVQWYYELLPYNLALGASLLYSTNFKEIFFTAQSSVERKRDAILNDLEISKDKFYSLLALPNSNNLSEDLITMESINEKLIQFVKNSINRDILTKNIHFMLKEREIHKIKKGNQVFYYIAFPSLLGFVLGVVKYNNEFKIIGLDDDV